ncbi:class I SAM-dependent methyltransferase [Advenella sp. RU8]|uniref:class I SAM-dependent methyltransferase n=1 Tax=Advenella sp. RU8 TaxID=3399575 RepID=UPI003AB08605
MTQHRDGYIIDVSYPLHFHKEMQPVWLCQTIKTLGCSVPDIDKAYRYCELGCGPGINLLVAAASNPVGQFVGVDFNKTHIAGAQAVAKALKIENIRFIEAGFDEFAEKNTEKFDFIVSHGTWSWLPPKAQAGILQLIHQSLIPQGLVYLHYMCYPGAARLTAMQKVLYEAAKITKGGSIQGINNGMTLLRTLANKGAGLFVDNPEIQKELLELEKELPAYLAHEFLTEHWNPQHSADVHRIVSQTGVSFIGSANGFENLDTLSIPGNLQPILKNLPGHALRETVKDMARNQHQRLDVFQSSPQTLDAANHLGLMDKTVFKALPKMPAPGPLEFKTSIGSIPGPAEIFSPLLATLKKGPQSFHDLRQILPFKKEPGLLLQALTMLMWADYAHPVRPEQQATPAAASLQAWLDKQQLPLRILPECGSAIMTQAG